MTIYKAPNHTPFNTIRKSKCIFLAGSIEMGEAENWQAKTGELLSAAGFIVLDPRRDDWDSSWEQSIQNENFKEQVSWELKGLEQSDAVLVYFDPNTKSPITLLEIGLLAKMKPSMTFIACPDGYWRKGNVEIVAERYKIFLSESMEKTVGEMLKRLQVETK